MKNENLFKITKFLIYLNHASTGVLPEPAVQKMESVINDFKLKGFPGIEYQDKILNTCKRRISKLLNGQPENIAFTSNTSQAIYIALVNIPFKKGDEIIVMEECFPAAKYIAEYNIPEINVKYLPFSEKNPVEVVANESNEKTKAVIVDYVQYFTGEKLPLKELSDYVRKKGIFLIVDGIQALGSVDIDVVRERIDIFACGGSKWLNGPLGTGFLYVSPYIFERMKKVHTGWLGAPWENFNNFSVLPEPFKDGRRFELGTRNLIGIAGLSESIRVILDYGPKNIEGKIRRLNAILLKGLKKKNYQILTPEDRMAGIVTAKPKDDTAENIYNRLKENKVIVSLRNNALRFSPHFYNIEKEINLVLKLI